jgi:hypothetical protein
MKIEGRKYEVALPGGRVVSRQRAHQLKQREKYAEVRRQYYQDNKEHIRARHRLWLEKFKEEHGIDYQEYYRAKRKAENGKSSKRVNRRRKGVGTEARSSETDATTDSQAGNEAE